MLLILYWDRIFLHLLKSMDLKPDRQYQLVLDNLNQELARVFVFVIKLRKMVQNHYQVNLLTNIILLHSFVHRHKIRKFLIFPTTLNLILILVLVLNSYKQVASSTTVQSFLNNQPIHSFLLTILFILWHRFRESRSEKVKLLARTRELDEKARKI